MSDHRKQQLSISLTEPVVFLRSSDPSGRLFDPNDPPTIVRGILTLNVPKPIAISSIDVELAGVLTVCYSDGIATRRTELFEKQKIYSSTITVFHADQVPHEKRPASVGSRLFPNVKDDRLTTLPRSTSLPWGHSARSSTVFTPTDIPTDLGPTPPYSPADQFPHPVWSGIDPLGDRTPNEPGRPLRDNLERGVNLDGRIPPPLHSRAFGLPGPTADFDASIIQHEPPHRESRNAVHPSSTFGDTLLPDTPEEPTFAPLRRPLSPSRSSRSQSYPCPRRKNGGISNSSASRSRLRLSFNDVLDTVMEVTSRAPFRSRSSAGSEERDRGRTRARAVAGEQSRENISESISGTGSGGQPGSNTSYLGGHMEHREHHFLNLGRVLGFKEGKDVHQKPKDRGGGWRELEPGTYSYPISFLLPSCLPPTFSLPRGSLDYDIKGVVHRPGTFTSKLSCRVPLLVVAAPTAGTGEVGGPGDPGPLNIQRQWEGKLAYSLELGSRLLLLGSRRHLETATSDDTRADSQSFVEHAMDARTEAAYGAAILNLTLLPLDKVRIWRLAVVVEQRISYFDGRSKLLRDEDNRRIKLLEVQDTCPTDEERTRKNKHAVVVLPLLPTPISPHRSPLLRYLSSSVDPSILAGPGPYTLSISIGLPNCGDRGLRFTMKQKGSFVKVEHLLQLIMRVERVGDEGAVDHEDKKRCFDITVRTPITILSCRCVPEYQTLPVYSPGTGGGLDRPTCPCQPGQGYGVGDYVGGVATSSVATSPESEGGVPHLHRPSGERRSDRGRSRSSSRTRQGGHRQGTLMLTPDSSRPPSPLVRYERLVSGLESEAGEAPPCYETLASYC